MKEYRAQVQDLEMITPGLEVYRGLNTLLDQTNTPGNTRNMLDFLSKSDFAYSLDIFGQEVDLQDLAQLENGQQITERMEQRIEDATIQENARDVINEGINRLEEQRKAFHRSLANLEPSDLEFLRHKINEYQVRDRVTQFRNMISNSREKAINIAVKEDTFTTGACFYTMNNFRSKTYLSSSNSFIRNSLTLTQLVENNGDRRLISKNSLRGNIWKQTILDINKLIDEGVNSKTDVHAEYFLILQAFSDIMAANPRPGSVVDFYISADRVYCDSCILLMLQMLAFCESRDITMRMHATSTPVNGIIRPTSGRWLHTEFYNDGSYDDEKVYIKIFKDAFLRHVGKYFVTDEWTPSEAALNPEIIDEINTIIDLLNRYDPEKNDNLQLALNELQSWGD